MGTEETRDKLVAHRVTREEFRDLALVAEVKGVTRSELLRSLVRREKRRLVEGPEETEEEAAA